MFTINDSQRELSKSSLTSCLLPKLRLYIYFRWTHIHIYSQYVPCEIKVCENCASWRTCSEFTIYPVLKSTSCLDQNALISESLVQLFLADNLIYLPGQGIWHASITIWDPVQFSPPYCGSGLEQFLVRVISPSPHSPEKGMHIVSVQFVQPPSTENHDNIKMTTGSILWIRLESNTFFFLFRYQREA